jgi:hypothetical protein
MASDAVNLIQALSKETVSYTPQGGAAKTIPAVIERPTIQVQAPGGQAGPANTLTLIIANDATDGVTSIKERFDTVSFKRNLDDSAVTAFVVDKIVAQDNGLDANDGGLWRLEVRA